MPNSCIICGHTKGKGDRQPKVSMHRFPTNEVRRQQWLVALNLTESDINEHSRVCSKHFLHGNSSNLPSLNIGRRFASPKKAATDRSIRAQKRESRSPSFASPSPSNTVKRLASSSVCASSGSALTPGGTTTEDEPMCVSVGEPLLSDYSIHELPSTSESKKSDTALAARVEFLEAETKHLSSLVNAKTAPQLFRVEHIARNASLVLFYTGFASYMLFINFFQFLGPSAHRLYYWGDTERKTTRRRKSTALNPLNQYFLTLMRLKLNLRVIDLANRFGISTSLVSKYFITWVCFMYQHLKEIDWTPSLEQVAATLPCAFQEKYPTTYSIIDASEIFIQMPSDLFIQSSTWSSYKHHNTAKFLIGCTPNGAVSFVSRLYVGSISDVELTKVSGFLDTLDGKNSASVMADRGFTIRDMLAQRGVELNIPPFMEGRKQMSAEDIQRGRHIASLRIHVERVIGRIKNYAILKGTMPNTLMRLANQIVSVCAWLTNFQPALIPPPSQCSTEDEVDRYFLTVEDSEYDADSENSETSDTEYEL